MVLSVAGQVFKWVRPSKKLSEGASLSKADGGNLKNHSHLTVAWHLREMTDPSLSIVTLREGEERGICCAALKELGNITNDQAEERSVVVIRSLEGFMHESIVTTDA